MTPSLQMLGTLRKKLYHIFIVLLVIEYTKLSDSLRITTDLNMEKIPHVNSVATPLAVKVVVCAIYRYATQIGISFVVDVVQDGQGGTIWKGINFVVVGPSEGE